MHVIPGEHGEVVVDDEVYSRNIKTPRGDIRGEQDGHLAAPEALQGSEASALGLVGVQRRRRDVELL